MTLAVGFHVVEGRHPGTVYPSSTCLDIDLTGGIYALQSPLSLCRIYFKSAPDHEIIARQAQATPFDNIVIGNEPNLPIEQFPGGADRFADYWTRVSMAVPNKKVWYPSPSPGVEGWRDWITHPDSRAAIAKSAGIAVHAYGELEDIKGTIWWYATTFPGTPLFLSEFNFGAGRQRDINDWARSTIRPLFDWIRTTVPSCVAATWFAFRWTADMPMGTSVDAEGTTVVTEIDAWIAANPVTAVTPQRAPEVNPLPQNQNPDKSDVIARIHNRAEEYGFPLPDILVRQIAQESGFRHYADDGSILTSSAGAEGIAQFMPAWWSTDVRATWQKSIDTMVRWMTDLFIERRSIPLALVNYNGGSGAVEAWKSGKPYDESVAYVTAIMGDVTIAQFGPDLATLGYSGAWINSACGPIAAQGSARILGIPLDMRSVFDTIGARSDLWTPNDGMSGSNAFLEALTLFGMSGAFIDADRARIASWEGRPVVFSTPKHYYCAQRPARNDQDFYVGNTGLARINGTVWMSPDTIRVRDGGLEIIEVTHMDSEPVPNTDDEPLTERLIPVSELTGEFDALWQATEIAAAQIVEIQRQVNRLKVAIGR